MVYPSKEGGFAYLCASFSAPNICKGNSCASKTLIKPKLVVLDKDIAAILGR